ncbi:MAG: hypothetical protein NZM11_06985, partial [Anaerolineales bacterium]|nr:hypothetical protein [Anaerolineales bacterium]
MCSWIYFTLSTQTPCLTRCPSPSSLPKTSTKGYYRNVRLTQDGNWCGYIKLELLKGDTTLNPFALRSKLYLRAIQSALVTLRELKPAQPAA